MVEFERIYGDRVNLFGAILARISRPNKLPVDASESSLMPGRGRGWTSPFSILRLTSSALSEAS
jgi:hypothetical protein